MNFIRHISNEMLRLKDVICTISQTTIKEKIAVSIVSLSKTQNTDKIVLNKSKKEWANELNVTRTSLSRELKNLKNKGIIDYKNRQLQILNTSCFASILDNME